MKLSRGETIVESLSRSWKGEKGEDFKGFGFVYLKKSLGRMKRGHDGRNWGGHSKFRIPLRKK